MRLISSALIDEVSDLDTLYNLDTYMKNKGYESRSIGGHQYEYGIPNQPSELRVTEDTSGFIVDKQPLKNSRKPVKSAYDSSVVSDSDIWERDGEFYSECRWCREEYPISDLKIEMNMGFLCDQCIAAIRSHGEPLTFTYSAVDRCKSPVRFRKVR